MTFRSQFTAVVLVRALDGSWKDIMKDGLSVFTPCHLSGYFPGIGKLDFPEFWHGARNPYEVVHDGVGVFEKNLFCSENQKNGPNVKKNVAINFH